MRELENQEKKLDEIQAKEDEMEVDASAGENEEKTWKKKIWIA